MNTADLFLWILDNLNYWVVTLFMAIESSFIPFPSEVVVPPAAWKAMDPNSGMSFILVIVFATIGADLGALINYYLAKWVGRPIIYSFADSRIGHMCLIDRKKVEVAEEFSASMVLHLPFRQIGTSGSPAYQYPCWTGRNARRQVPALHNYRCRCMEHRIGNHRLGNL